MSTVTEEIRKVYVVRLASGRRRRYITESAAYRAAAWAFYQRRDQATGDMWWEATEGQDRRRKVVARLARWLQWRDQRQGDVRESEMTPAEDPQVTGGAEKRT